MLTFKSRGWSWIRAGLCLGFAFALFCQVEAAPKEPAPVLPAIAMPPPPEWIRSEFVFNLQGKDGAELTQGEWEQFISEVIMPKFPDHWTMVEGFGKNKGLEGSFDREPVNILILIHPNNGRLTEALQEVASQYKKRFQLPVMLVNTPAEVAFY